MTVVGLTSAGNVEFVEGLGCYDQVVTYDDIASLPPGPAVFVDMSGNAAVVRAVHEHYGDDLTHSAIVGLTHWEDRLGKRRSGAGPALRRCSSPRARSRSGAGSGGPG